MAIEGNIKTPLGEVPKKTALIAGGGAVLVIGVVYYRSRQAANSSQTAANGSGTSDSTLDPSIYDQSTGQTWASEGLGPYGEDPNGGQFNAGNSTGSGQIIGYDSAGNPIYSPAGGTAPNTGPGSFTNNAQWAQYAEDYLVNTVGMDAATVGNALGKYISGAGVDDTQFGVIQSAIAFAGPAPVAGTAGFPPSINHIGTPPGTGNAQNPVGGLKVTDDGFTSITVGWNKSTGAKSYLVTVLDGSKKVASKTVTGTTARMGNLKRGTSYTIRVRAQPGGTGGNDANVNAKTKGGVSSIPPTKGGK
jgi:hypothetical protein